MRILLFLLFPNLLMAQEAHNHKEMQGHDAPILSKIDFEISGNNIISIGEANYLIGNDYDKLKIRTEWENNKWENKNGYADIYYSKYYSDFFDFNIGIGKEYHGNNYALIGFEGLLPYNIETRTNLKIGDENNFRLELHSDYYFTQKLFLRPKINLEQNINKNQYDNNYNLGVYYKINPNLSPFVNLRKTNSKLQTAIDDNAVLFGINFWF